MRRSFRVRILWVAIVVGIQAPFHFPLTLATDSSEPQGRNAQWLEDQIDTFLTAAQNNGDPTDIQVSSCKISGQQLVATAQATIARVLKGVCDPSQFEQKFHNLEVQLGDQLNVIKAMIISLEEKVVQMDQDLKSYQNKNENLEGRKLNGTGQSFEKVSSQSMSQSEPERANQIQRPTTLTNQNSYPDGARFDEITRYNSTVSIENGRRVFSYYWIIPGMSYKLSSWSLRRALQSSSFYIYPRGYRMYLKVIPRYTSQTMYVHTGLTKGDYDDWLSWPFENKLRISVLSTEDGTGASDLKSRVWDPKVLCSGSNWMKPVAGNNPECLGLGFPHDVLKSSEYVHMDRTIIKLSVYLD